MKIILTVFIATLSIANLKAMCAWNGLSVFPSGKTISPEPIIVIEGYEASQEIVKGLNNKYSAYLVSDKHKILLTVTEILIGQFRLTQAVLIPETILTTGLDYTLMIDSLPKGESLDRWNPELKKSEPVKYTVGPELDNTKPVFDNYPKEINKSLIHLGCGPSIHVVFDCNVTDSSEYLVKATVKNLETGKETSYYLEPVEGTVKIGHGMCSGAFTFGEGDNYEVEFSLMDASGNFTAWIGDRIKFTRPIGKDNSDK